MTEIFASLQLTCPVCETRRLIPCDRPAMRCSGCGRALGGPMLRTLIDIARLPVTPAREDPPRDRSREL